MSWLREKCKANFHKFIINSKCISWQILLIKIIFRFCRQSFAAAHFLGSCGINLHYELDHFSFPSQVFSKIHSVFSSLPLEFIFLNLYSYSKIPLVSGLAFGCSMVRFLHRSSVDDVKERRIENKLYKKWGEYANFLNEKKCKMAKKVPSRMKKLWWMEQLYNKLWSQLFFVLFWPL